MGCAAAQCLFHIRHCILFCSSTLLHVLLILHSCLVWESLLHISLVLFHLRRPCIPSGVSLIPCFSHNISFCGASTHAIASWRLCNTFHAHAWLSLCWCLLQFVHSILTVHPTHLSVQPLIQVLQSYINRIQGHSLYYFLSDFALMQLQGSLLHSTDAPCAIPAMLRGLRLLWYFQTILQTFAYIFRQPVVLHMPHTSYDLLILRHSRKVAYIHSLSAVPFAIRFLRFSSFIYYAIPLNFIHAECYNSYFHWRSKIKLFVLVSLNSFYLRIAVLRNTIIWSHSVWTDHCSWHTAEHAHRSLLTCTEHVQIFLHTILLRADHQYLNGQHLACEVLTRMYVILNRSGLLFIYKMIQEIISIPRADSGYPIILWSNLVFSRMTSPKLRLKPTADLECVCSWSKVRTSHV